MPEQYLTPPPPHELLTAKSSFYARSGLFFPFIFSLVFALTACNSGGGGSSSSKMQDPSGDGGNGSSDDVNIVFSPFDNTADTVIGMREFLLTVTYKDLADGGEKSLVFIVGESATPPDWDAVENHPAKITRSFDNADKQTREIYFSTTERYQGVTSKLIDLASGDEKELVKANAPGIMTPNTPYYIHVYTGEKHVTTSTVVTTLNYPSTFPRTTSDADWAAGNFPTNAYRPDGKHGIGSYFWAMNKGLDKTVRSIETKTNEVYFLPFRFVAMSSATAAVGCGNNLNQIEFATVIPNTSTGLTTRILPYPSHTGVEGKPFISFIGNTDIQDNYYDVMFLFSENANADSYVTPTCLTIDSTNPVFYLDYRVNLKVVTE